MDEDNRMPFDKSVEVILREAMQRGDFDNLPGKGKPINVDGYFATPAEVRQA